MANGGSTPYPSAGRAISPSSATGRLAATAPRSGRSASRGRRYLIDNSVWSRLAAHEVVADAFRGLVNRVSPATIHICPPIVAEYGFSTRSGSEHTTLMQRLRAFPDCPTAPTSEQVLSVQNALWTGGLLRAAGAMDTLIAAYALANGATVMHYDSDFEHIASVVPQLHHEWIVPRDSI